MKPETIAKLKPHEYVLNLSLNYAQTYDPSRKDVKEIVAIFKDLNPDAKPFCETCWADANLKVMDVASDYFAAIKKEEKEKAKADKKDEKPKK
jgi:hypothetical protein